MRPVWEIQDMTPMDLQVIPVEKEVDVGYNFPPSHQNTP